MEKVILMAELVPENGCLDAVLYYISLWHAETRKQPGCLSTSLSVSKDGSKVYTVDHWTDEESMVDYLDWLADQGDLIKISAYLAEEPVSQTLTLVDPEFYRSATPPDASAAAG